MNDRTAHEITAQLRAWSEGDDQALARLTPVIYKELYRIARHCMARQKAGHTLQGTALVNEVYVRLAGIVHVDWQDRAHFFAFCARSMRHILTDYARAQQRQKRGGQAQRVSLEEVEAALPHRTTDLLALDEALIALGRIDERKSRVVELRFFGGLSVKETAEVLDISEDSVIRDWKFAKHWLLNELRAGNSNGK
jgi:RNA polymerase sigma-70 factor (ECF subfamily)